MPDEVIARSYVHLLPKADGFGRSVGQQIRQQLGLATGQVQRQMQQQQRAYQKQINDLTRNNQKLVKSNVQAAQQAARGMSQSARQVSDSHQRESAKIGRSWLSAHRGIERDAARTTIGVSRRFGDMRAGIFQSFRGLGGVLAGVLAGGAVVGFLKSSISAASDLNETVSKTAQIFGQEALPGLQQWARGAATAFGQSQQEALDAASSFALFGKSAGLSGQGVLEFSKQTTQLASDMASFFNTSPEEAITAIGAAFRGESEPIRRYNVLIDDASARQEAVRLGIIKTTKQALTPQQRILAVHALIMKQTAAAQGDFARTSGGLANQQRILSKQIVNAKVSLGTIFLPVALAVVGFLNRNIIPAFGALVTGIRAMIAAFREGDVTSDGFVGVMERVGVAARLVVQWFQSNVLPVLKQFGDYVRSTVIPAVSNAARALATALAPALSAAFGWISRNRDLIKPFAVAVGGLIVLVKAWSIAQGILNVVMAANPLVLVAVALGVLAAALYRAYQQSEGFRTAVQNVWKWVSANAIPIIQRMWAFMKAQLGPALGELGATIKNKVWPAFRDLFAVLSAYVLPWLGKLLGFLAGAAFVGAIMLIRRLIDTVTFALKLAAFGMQGLKVVFGTIIPFLIRTFLTLVGAVLNGAATAFGWLPKIGGPLKAAAGKFNTFKDQVNRSLDKIHDQEVTVKPKMTIPPSWGAIGGPALLAAAHGRAMGGPVYGPGTTTSDSIPTMLSNQEHVWSAREVRGAGGHSAMERMRGMARAGALPRLATGGRPTQVSVAGRFPSARGDAIWSNRLALAALAVARPVATVLGTAVARAIMNASSGPGGSSPGLTKTVAWGKSQAGKPYIWGGVGPRGYDCSGFVSALLNYARGRNPYRRLGATGTMPWAGMVPGVGPFMIGWFRGSPGHTAATINGVNFESAGGVGVRFGRGARGATNRMFTRRARVKGFASGGRPSGEGVAGDLPFDWVSPRGQRYLGSDVLKQVGRYDRGAWRVLADQLAVVHRGEMVFPEAQADRLRRLYAASGRTAPAPAPRRDRDSGYLRLHPDDRRVLEALARRPIDLNGKRLAEGLDIEANRRG